MLGPLDVIWIDDDTIRPPGPKMVVCVQAELGLFFRINTRAGRQTSLSLRKESGHAFLHHDSYLECGEPLELDAYIVEEALRRRRIVGSVSRSLIPDILRAVRSARSISEADKQAIARFLEASGG